MTGQSPPRRKNPRPRRRRREHIQLGVVDYSDWNTNCHHVCLGLVAAANRLENERHCSPRLAFLFARGPLALRSWVGSAVLLVGMVAGLALMVWLGPSLCEEDPAFCEGSQEEPTYFPLWPVAGVLLMTLTVLGVMKMSIMMYEQRKKQKEGKP